MSINSEIERIRANISDAYDAIGTKFGSIPDVRNSANLVESIESINTLPDHHTYTDCIGSINNGILTIDNLSRLPRFITSIPSDRITFTNNAGLIYPITFVFLLCSDAQPVYMGTRIEDSSAVEASNIYLVQYRFESKSLELAFDPNCSVTISKQSINLFIIQN